MFVQFTRQTKITVLGHEITISEILSCMLRQSDISWLDCPFAPEGNRPFEKLPEALQEVAVKNPYFLCAYGMFIPIARSPNFQVFSKDKFQDQLNKVIADNLSIILKVNSNNFLLKIPKFFIWKQSFNDDNPFKNKFTQLVDT